MSKAKAKKGKDRTKDHAGGGEVSGVETLAYKVLTQNQAQDLISMTVDEMQAKLADIFSLGDHVIDLKLGATLDYYTAAIHWAVQKGMSEQVLSAFFTIVHELLENVREKQMTVVENMIEFKKLMTTATLQGDNVQTGATDIIDSGLAKEISDYIFTSLFQHYHLHLFMFSRTQAEEIIGTDLEVEVCQGVEVPFPPPLEEGIPEDKYLKFLVAPPPQETSEKEDTSEEQKKTEDQLAKETEKQKMNQLVNVFEDMQPEEIKEIISSVAREMLSSLQGEVANKLIEKENQILARINKVHNIDV